MLKCGWRREGKGAGRRSKAKGGGEGGGAPIRSVLRSMGMSEVWCSLYDCVSEPKGEGQKLEG
jgi:hypothetical protein